MNIKVFADKEDLFDAMVIDKNIHIALIKKGNKIVFRQYGIKDSIAKNLMKKRFLSMKQAKEYILKEISTF